MKIMIDATPEELAGLIFALVDCDVEVDAEEEEFDEDEETANHGKGTRNQFVQLLCKILEQANKKAP